jgi:alkylation response protein AidB-like acyl-CoA dehydrogenase
MFTMMNRARHGVGIEGVGLAERAYQQALAYSQERVQGYAMEGDRSQRVTIDHHPDVQRMLLSISSRVEAMRALSYGLQPTMTGRRTILTLICANKLQHWLSSLHRLLKGGALRPQNWLLTWRCKFMVVPALLRRRG